MIRNNLPVPPSSNASEKDVRVRAVQLRQSGATLAQVKAATGLTAPTIIALNKVFETDGMQAVQSRKVGRPLKSASDIKTSNTKRWGSTWEQLWLTSTEHPWTIEYLAQWLSQNAATDPRDKSAEERGSVKPIKSHMNSRASLRLFKEWGWMPPKPPTPDETFLEKAARQKLAIFTGGEHALPSVNNQHPKYGILYAQDRRGKLFWNFYRLPLSDDNYLDFCQKLLAINPKGFALQLQFAGLQYTPALAAWLAKNGKIVIINNTCSTQNINTVNATAPRQPSTAQSQSTTPNTTQFTPPSSSPLPPLRAKTMPTNSNTLTHLQRLEAESIHILREVVAEADKPVMLYSIGKDSAVMLHLALKAFYPAPLPFPLLHVDTTWKFKDMYAFRDRMQQEHDFELISHINPDGLTQGINPFTHGSQIHTDIMKTQGLKQALDKHGFDVAFGGARRDEEKSRAKERIFSFRNSQHRWDPKQQRPELWNLYNTKKHKGESIRVFPISNWTELDIWQYIYLENIPIVPLYFAHERPVVERDGTLIMVDDERMPLAASEVPMIKKVRFRTLGCYPLTGAVESQATTLPQIIQEMLLTTTSERQGRVIDHDGAASMEKKKQEGYF